MPKSQQLFSTFSIIRLVKTIIVRVFIGSLIVLLFNELLEEFHWGVASLEVLLIYIFIIHDQREVIIIKDSIRIQTNYLFGVFKRYSEFKKSEIETIDLYGKYSMKSDIIEDLLSFVFHKGDTSNQLVIITTDGKMHTYDLHIYKQDLEHAIEFIGFGTTNS